MKTLKTGQRHQAGRRRVLKAAAATAALSGFGFPAIVRGQSALNVGVLLPVSGVQAFIGQSCKRGADIAPDVLAALGYKVSLKLMHADIESSWVTSV